jgi:hypothetical protein
MVFEQQGEVGKAVWKDFLPSALMEGRFKPAPPATVVGTGLEHLQDGLEKSKKGVSATKLVILLWKTESCW